MNDTEDDGIKYIKKGGRRGILGLQTELSFYNSPNVPSIPCLIIEGVIVTPTNII